MRTDVHVIPVNDLREHVETRDCWCGPDVEERATGAVIIHHAVDGRDLIERHGIN